MKPIRPKEVRYIKLGRGGRWEDVSLERGEIHFGYRTITHELARSGDWDAVLRHYMDEQGRSRSKARSFIREIRDFYTLDSDCLWITFARGHLWWAFAEPEVIWMGGDGLESGSRIRKTIGPWRNEDIAGKPLRVDTLSTRLTQLASYQQTLCGVREQEYLLRKINALEEPAVKKALEIRATMIKAIEDMIASLHWADFEILVDLIFARSGWQRVSRLGETQKDVDMILEQSATGERAFVQVKSQARQAVLDDYVKRFEAGAHCDRMFFICHTPIGNLRSADQSSVHVWTRETLAETILKAGLFDWLIERTR